MSSKYSISFGNWYNKRVFGSRKNDILVLTDLETLIFSVPLQFVWQYLISALSEQQLYFLMYNTKREKRILQISLSEKGLMLKSL